ncbi:choice-of-anchor A family protein [Oerskovia flava]|uniref:choice-of-anchor A family protein n=1 Tax=Oerskovia flava TaxID=2986422 RepID=UPI00223F4F5D|nr:choice-of-anchor A family protein [Oerskovia sp. JB1-3-2]
MVRPTSRRRRRAACNVLLAATLAAGATATSAGAATSARADTAAGTTCPAPGELPGLGGTLHSFTDHGVAVYVGGSYQAVPGAKESEGLLVVEGDATFAAGQMNVGTVGVGSGITPDAGEMLVVGADLTVDRGPVQVGFGTDPGGDVIVGGTLHGQELLDTQGTGDATRRGVVRTGVGDEALAEHGSLGATLTSLSSSLGAAAPTGTTRRDGPSLTFTSTTGSGPQTFSVDAAELAQVREIRFVGVSQDAPVVVNVSGERVELSPTYQAFGAARIDDPTSSGFGNAASQILWNLAEATEVTLGTNDQLVGSVLVPASSGVVTVRTSTNGRLWVAGDLVVGGSGTHGLEHHAYPWIGAPELGCDRTPSPAPEPPAVVPPTEPDEPPAASGPGTDTDPAPSANVPAPGSPTGGLPTEQDEPRAPVDPSRDDDAGRTAGPDPAAGAGPAPTPAAGTDTLARTGAGVGVLVGAALTLLAAGGLLVVTVRRRAAR